jgi:hypothetical protein
MIEADRGLLVKASREQVRHLRKARRPIFLEPRKPVWRLLVEGVLLLILGAIAVAAFAAMVFAITGV